MNEPSLWLLFPFAAAGCLWLAVARSAGALLHVPGCGWLGGAAGQGSRGGAASYMVAVHVEVQCSLM